MIFRQTKVLDMLTFLKNAISVACIAVSASITIADDAATSHHDVVIYGGTSAAITAAVQVKRMGCSVIVVSPDKHLGGLTSGGLGFTDSGNKNAIGGLSREFYQRVYAHYSDDAAWVQQTRDSYGNRGQGHLAREDDARTMWVFEPKVAEAIFEAFVAEYQIDVVRDAWLDRQDGVTKTNGRIQSITTLDGRRFAGEMFIDATYEGDLIAAAGVETTVGRESASQYNEPHNGVQPDARSHAHHFGVLSQPVDPYVIPGDPTSGVLPLISTEPPGNIGDGDDKVQAYCFRTCLTNFDPNRIPFPKPEGYRPETYEVLARCLDAGWDRIGQKFDAIPNRKTDTNNHGPVSFDHIGANYDYPEASYERRREIIADHENYQKGMLYFMANDPRAPKEIRDDVSTWGLAADEFIDNGNWPHQLYIREARRMVGALVMTENHLTKQIPTPDSIGMGSYTIDSHNVQRYITAEGHVENEGDIGVPTNGPYVIAKDAILPKRDQCTNLLVPVCVSSSHIAFGSIRMEPVFMILGQSAATIAVMAIEENQSVQEVDYESLRTRLIADGQVLEADPSWATPPKRRDGWAVESQRGVIVDDRQAKTSGQWTSSSSSLHFFGSQYLHNNNENAARKSIRFDATLPKSGTYDVRFSYPPSDNRCTKTPVTIHHRDGQTTVRIDQRKAGSVDDQYFVSVGQFEFDSSSLASVVVTTEGTNGYVVADAVEFVLAE